MDEIMNERETTQFIKWNPSWMQKKTNISMINIIYRCCVYKKHTSTHF